MSKILKRFLIVLIVLIGAILVIPKSEHASVELKDSDEIYGSDEKNLHLYDRGQVVKTWEELKSSKEIYVVNPGIVNNKNIFCIEENEHLTNGKWRITETIKIDSYSSNWAHGLAYLLDQAEIGMGADNDWEEDNVQLAIWSYLHKTSETGEIEKFFGNIDKTANTDHSNDNEDVKDLVNKAMKYYNGEEESAFEAILYVMKYVPKSNPEATGEEEDFQTVILVEKTEPPKPKTLNIELQKKSTGDSNQIVNAEFVVLVDGASNYGNQTPKLVKTENGKLTLNPPIKTNNSKVTIRLKENKTDEGFELDPNEYRVTLEHKEEKWEITKLEIYNSEDEAWDITTSDTLTGGIVQDGETTLKLVFKNKPDDGNIKLNLRKLKAGTEEKADAKFKINVENAGNLTGIQTFSTQNGERLLEIEPKSKDLPIIIHIKEVEVVGNFRLDDTQYAFTLQYNKTSKKWEILNSLQYNEANIKWENISGNNVYGSISDGKNLDIKFYNEPDDENIKLNLRKLNADTNEKADAKFQINVENAGNLTGTQTFSTQNGERLLEIEPKSKDLPVTIQIKEIAVVGDFKLDSTTYTFKLKYNKSNDKWEIVENTDGGNVEGNITGGRTLNIKFYNEPDDEDDEPTTSIINATIDGYVWGEGQIGDKNLGTVNGIFNSGDEKLKGIKVTVKAEIQKLRKRYSWQGSYYDEDEDTRTFTETVYTNAQGYYNVKVPLKKYRTRTRGINYYEYITDFKVTFYYDGVQYITYMTKNDYRVSSSTSSAKQNNAAETTSVRTTFNDKFSLVKLNKNSAGRELAYGSWTRTNNTNMGTSKLNIAIDGSTAGNYYQMSSTTGNITTTFDKKTSNQNIRNVCLALNGRYLDLAVSTNVDHTKVSIKGYETTYNYGNVNIKTNDALNKWLDSVLDKSNMVNVNIYPTDYHYRITDYLYSGALRTDESISRAIASMTPDELEVEVTFKVEMFNQSYANADIRELVYYYDSNYYTLKGINSKADGTGRAYTAERASNSYGIPTGYTGVVINGEWDVSGNNSQYLYLTFSLNKNTDGYRKLGNIEGNIVAITSYHTTAGLLDWDSSTRPITSGPTVQWEDDTAKSENVNVKLSSEVRTISGNIFEDANLDGILNNNDTAIKDIVVQLIEIKKDGSGNPREIITQETKVGSRLVTTISNGYNTTKDNNYGDYIMYNYENNVTEGSGEYEFLNIVPGNYIVRFLYGDGYNYDIVLNNTKYNGFDYKSTKDPNYKSEWYNGVRYNSNSSVARDNEARRLEVMGVTTQIDGGLGTALEVYATNKELQSLSNVDKANIVSYIQKLAQKEDNELYATISKEFNTVNMNEIRSIANNININTLNDKYFNVLKKCVAYKTFMAADTSKINIPIDATSSQLQTVSNSSVIGSNRSTYGPIEIVKDEVKFENVNFGLMKKPEIKLELEKHITGLKITTNGTGVQEPINAKADITDIINSGTVNAQGETKGLATVKSTRAERGFWKVETNIEELSQGAGLEVEYTYVIKNNGDPDYISSTLVDKYKNNPNEYSIYLIEEGKIWKNSTIGDSRKYGKYLGNYYYTGSRGNGDVEVTSRVEEMAEAINNQLRYEQNIAGSDFKVAEIAEEKHAKNIYNTDGVAETEKIDTVIETTNPTTFLTTGRNNEGTWRANIDVDLNKRLKLTRVLSSLSTDKETNIPSYLAEVLRYSSVSGGRNKEAVPENLNYVHSKDNEMELDNSYIYEVNGKMYAIQDINSIPAGATKVRKANESDEFWGETITISKPTGENKILALQIGITVAISVAVIGVGIVLIRKFVFNH